MDLQWRVARKRQWIEYGIREGLTNRVLAQEVGVTERTIRRWCDEFREEERARALSISTVLAAAEISSPSASQPLEQTPAPTTSETPPVEATEPDPEVPSFAEVVEAAPAPGPQIQIDIKGGGRIVISGALQPALLSRLIDAVHAC